MLKNNITQVKLPVCTEHVENAVENNPFKSILFIS